MQVGGSADVPQWKNGVLGQQQCRQKHTDPHRNLQISTSPPDPLTPYKMAKLPVEELSPPSSLLPPLPSSDREVVNDAVWEESSRVITLPITLH